MNTEQTVNQWGQIVAKAWQDDKFKNRLLAEPAAVFQEFGVEVPAGVQLRVVENTDQVVHLTLPAEPREGELSDDDLENVAGGFGSVLASFAYAAKALSKGGAGGGSGSAETRLPDRTGPSMFH